MSLHPNVHYENRKLFGKGSQWEIVSEMYWHSQVIDWCYGCFCAWLQQNREGIKMMKLWTANEIHNANILGTDIQQHQHKDVCSVCVSLEFWISANKAIQQMWQTLWLQTPCSNFTHRYVRLFHDCFFPRIVGIAETNSIRDLSRKNRLVTDVWRTAYGMLNVNIPLNNKYKQHLYRDCYV